MTTKFTTISIPRERGLQLRDLAHAQGKTVSELVTSWIVREMTERGAQDAFAPLQGCIKKQHGFHIVEATFFGRHRAVLSSPQAHALSGSLQSMATEGGSINRPDLFGGDALDPCCVVEVERRGSGVILRIDAFEHSMNTDVACEIAAQLASLAQMARAETAKHRRERAHDKITKDGEPQVSSSNPPRSSLRRLATEEEPTIRSDIKQGETPAIDAESNTTVNNPNFGMFA